MTQTHPQATAKLDKKASRQRAAARRAALLEVPVVQVVSSAEDMGRQVRANRNQQGLRIDDAAALSGVSVDLMSRLENGFGSIRLDKLMSVLDGLGLTLLVAPKGHAYLRQLPQGHVLAATATSQTAGGAP